MPIGYADNLSIIEQESNVVRYVFEKLNQYCANPPESLIMDKMRKLQFENKSVTYEEAARRVNLHDVENYIFDEIHSNPDMLAEIKTYSRRIGVDKIKDAMNGKMTNLPHRNAPIQDTTIENIVSDELSYALRDRMKKKVCCYVRASENDPFLQQKIDELIGEIQNHSDWIFHSVVVDHSIGVPVDRDILNMILDKASNNEFDIVLVRDSSQISRDISQLSKYIMRIREYGADVLSKSTGAIDLFASKPMMSVLENPAQIVNDTADDAVEMIEDIDSFCNYLVSVFENANDDTTECIMAGDINIRIGDLSLQLPLNEKTYSIIYSALKEIRNLDFSGIFHALT